MAASELIARQYPDCAALITALERLLRQQLEGHQRLLICIERKRQAIRDADIERVTAICREENIIVQRLTETEKQRLELLGHLTSTLQPQADKPLAVIEIARSAPEPQQSVLIALAAQLREVLMEAKRQSSMVRAAAQALSRHMSGIVHTVHSALSRARVYSHRGTITLGLPVQSTLDLKS